MAVSQQQKVDFLLKKLGFTKTKTGLAVDSTLTGTKKAGFAEAIPSPLIIANSSVWNEADSIPATPPGSDTNQVKVYLAASSGHRMTVDSTVAGNRAFIAFSTYNDTSSTRLNNWIDTQFGAGYLIKVFKGDPNSGGVQLSAAGSGADDGWFFDYSAGVLNFNDTSVPSGVTGTNIYIVGYRYIGQTGAPTSGISTFSFLDLTVERNLDVGVQGGISTFRNNIDLNADLDVDGHTNLDNVSVVGVATFSEDIIVNGLTVGKGASSGNNNTALGAGAFDRTGTGAQNTAIGNNALTNNQGGNGGTAVGHDAAFGNTSGNSNTAVGRDALRSNNSSDGNTAIGRAALYYNSAENNTALGQNSLFNVGAGKSNTAVGQSAGNNIVQGSNNLILGYNAQATAANVSNEITLGNSLMNHLRVPGIGVSFSEGGAFISGIVTATELDISGDIDVDGHTNLDNVSIAGVTTFSGNINLPDSVSAVFGTDDDGSIKHTGTNLQIFETTGNIQITNYANDKDVVISSDDGSGGTTSYFTADGSTGKASLHYYGASKLETNVTGVRFTGHAQPVSNNNYDLGSSSLNWRTVYAKTGDFSGDLDVDGHTNLDNISVAGVSTFTGDATFAGNVSIGGTLTYEDVTNVDSVGLLTARSGIRVTGGVIEALAGENKIPSLYANMAALPSAGSYHGMFAHVHATGRGYFAHAGNWLELVNKEINGVVGTGTERYNVGPIDAVDINVSSSSTTKSLNVTGVTTAVTVDINGDLDVDGHTNLDNVSCSGILTAQNFDYKTASNIRIGQNAAPNATMNRNIAIGDDTLKVVDTHNNIAIGYAAGERVSTGQGGNVLIGRLAGNYLTTSSATFIGNASGRYQTGNTNTAVGSASLQGSSGASGESNTALGFWSLRESTSSDENTAAGFRSLLNLTSSSDQNTGIGAYALHSITSGSSKNTSLGYRAGDALVTGSNNIIIGYGADASTTTTSNEITLGDANITHLRVPGIGVSFNNTGGTQLGIITATELDISGDIDVDGHTNLDNVSVAGVTTFTGAIDANGDLDVDGHTNLDNVSVGGATTMSGDLMIDSPSGQGLITIQGTSPRIAFTDTDHNPDYRMGNSNGQFFLYDVSNGKNRFTVYNNIFSIPNGTNLDVDGHTNLDNVSVAGVTTFSNNVHVGTGVTIETNGQATFSGITTSRGFFLPISTGSNTDNIFKAGDLKIFDNGSHIHIQAPYSETLYDHSGTRIILTNDFRIQNTASSRTYFRGINLGAASLYWAGSNNHGVHLATTEQGVEITGHSELDNINVAGVSTFAGNIDANGDLDVDGHTNLDNVSISGITTTDGQIKSTYNHASEPRLHLSGISASNGYNYLLRGDNDGGSRAVHFVNGSARTADNGQNTYTIRNDGGKLHLGRSNYLTVLQGSTTYLQHGTSTKLQTSSTGINVTGDTETDTLNTGNATFTGTITAGGATGTNGQYLKSTGSGVAWASFPTLRTRNTFTASAGQTTFSFSYTVNFLDVFVNGIKLTDAEFTASNGSSVVLAVGCFVGDIVELVSYNTVSGGGGGGGSLNNIVEDTTPQLGGNLDLFNKSITGTGGINITGVVTATTFIGDGSGLTGIVASGSGVVVKNSGSTVGTAGTINFGNNLSVTPISAGIVTITGFSGITTNSGVVSIANDLDVDGHTNLDNVSIAGVSTFVGNVNLNGGNLILGDSGSTSDDRIVLGASSDLMIYHNGSDSVIRDEGTGNLNLQTLNSNVNVYVATNELAAKFISNGAVELYHDNVKKLETYSGGVSISGSIVASGNIQANTNITISNIAPQLFLVDTNNDSDFAVQNNNGTFTIKDTTNTADRFTINSSGNATFAENLNVTGDLDVDGHTELDNVNIAGVVTATTFKGAVQATSGTFSSNVDITGDLDVNGHTDLDNVSIAGVVTATTFVGALTGNASGNAATATALQNARTIGGVSFDGTANINLPGVNSAGNQDTSGTAAVATNVTVSANNTTNETVYPVFVDGATGSQGAETDTGLTYNPSTGNLTATKFTGDGSGLTGITASGSGIVIKHDGSTVGTAGTINFGTNLDVSAISGGAVTITASGGGSGISTISGVVNIANDLDVDGHTNLDNVSVAGVSTFAGSTYFTNQDNYFKHDNATVRFQRTSSATQQGAIIVGNQYFDIFTHSGGSGGFRIYTGGSYKLSLNSSGTLTATTFSGSGASLTNLPAANLTGTLPAIDGSNLTGVNANVGITTNLSGTFTASAGSPSTINTFGYGSGDIVVEYTVFIKNGSNFQSQKLLAMRDGTTIHSTQFAIMYSSSLLVQLDATISSGNILLRATPETGVSGSTTYKVKREVM